MLQFVTLIATIGNVLKIKPILRRNKDGYIVTYKNVRGSKAALNTLINLVCDNIIKPEEQIIDIAHADAYEDSLYIMDKIREKSTYVILSTHLTTSAPEVMSVLIQLPFSLSAKTENWSSHNSSHKKAGILSDPGYIWGRISNGS